MVQLEMDLTTYLLGGVVLSLLLLGIYLRPPPPLLHPFLLGRQSLASRTRYTGESPVYTSSVTSGGRPALRPGKTRTLAEVLEATLSKFEGAPGGTWIKGGEKVKDVVLALRAGLLSTLGNEEGLVAVLVEDPTDALLVTLALTLTKYQPLVISPGSNLPSTTAVAAIIQSSTLYTVAQGLSTTPAAKWISLGGGGETSNVAEDLLVTGKALLADEEHSIAPIPERKPTDVALTIVSEGVPLELTHLNLTASLVSWLSVFPSTPVPSRPDIKDFILSFHHPSTPFGFGLAVFALFSNTAVSFHPLPTPATPESLAAIVNFSPPVTILLAPSEQLAKPLYVHVLSQMLQDAPFVIQRGRDAKLRLLREGTLSQSTMWDSFLFDSVREKSRLHHLKAIVFDGPVLQNQMDFFRLALGSPVFTVKSHAFLLAPATASMMFDVQRLPPFGKEEKDMMGQELTHVGAPAVGVELKFRGSESDMVSGRIRGEVLLRSPTLPQPSTLPSSLLQSDAALPQLPGYPSKSAGTALDEQGSDGMWLRTGLRAELGTEGVVWLEH